MNPQAFIFLFGMHLTRVYETNTKINMLKANKQHTVHNKLYINIVQHNNVKITF